MLGVHMSSTWLDIGPAANELNPLIPEVGPDSRLSETCRTLSAAPRSGNSWRTGPVRRGSRRLFQPVQHCEDSPDVVQAADLSDEFLQCSSLLLVQFAAFVQQQLASETWVPPK